MSRQSKINRVLSAGRENGTGAIIFQQTVGHLLGLNATDMKCLDVIVTNGATSPSQLAELTGLTTGAITVLIDRLEKAGLVERKPDPGDRRRTSLVPTRAVERKVAPLYRSMAKAMFQLASKYSVEELDVLERFFIELTGLWKRETAKLKR